MFIETITDLDRERAGWFTFCQAEFIFYGDSVNNLFYVFKTQDLRDFVTSHIIEERKAADYTYRGEVRKVSQGMLVPIQCMIDEYDVTIISLSDGDTG